MADSENSRQAQLEGEISGRLRVARELHDGLAQELAAIGYRLDAVIGREGISNQSRLELRELRQHLSQTLHGLRAQIFMLRNPSQQNFGSQIHSILEQIFKGSAISFALNGAIEVSQEVSFELLAAISEISRNSVRHSQCTSFSVELMTRKIVITDNGQGGVIEKPDSWGVLSIQERVEQIGWTVHCHSDGSGTRYELEQIGDEG